jgi:hypothetical protein
VPAEWKGKPMLFKTERPAGCEIVYR